MVRVYIDVYTVLLYLDYFDYFFKDKLMVTRKMWRF